MDGALLIQEVRSPYWEGDWERVCQAEGTACAKALRSAQAWQVWRAVRRPMQLKQIEQQVEAKVSELGWSGTDRVGLAGSL